MYSISRVIQNQSDCVIQCSNNDLCSSVFTADQEISPSAFIININNAIVSGQEFDVNVTITVLDETTTRSQLYIASFLLLAAESTDEDSGVNQDNLLLETLPVTH